MPKKFRTLAARTMAKASRARATKRTKTMLAEMHLNELRRAVSSRSSVDSSQRRAAIGL